MSKFINLQESQIRNKKDLPIPLEEIQKKAFEIFLEKGGDDIDNWLEAEKILREERLKSPSF